MNAFVLLVSPPGCQEDDLRQWEDFLELHDIPFEHRKNDNADDDKKCIKIDDEDGGRSSCPHSFLTFVLVKIPYRQRETGGHPS